MDYEFETTRTGLLSAFVEAGAKLLAYQPLASTAVAAIPDTQPQKYAIAGTLPGILQMAGKMMGEEGAEQPLTIALGQGLIEVGQGHHGDERLPAILFGRNGAGAVGIETEGNRVMKPGECIAAITFENPQSLDVVAEKLGELRARIWPDAEILPAKYVIAPHFRGYACLGIGAYIINHSAKGELAELVISVATDEEKAGRTVGDSRDNAPGAMVQPEAMAVRLRFENVAGLDALEQQLRFVRSVHFPESASQEGAHAAQWISVDERLPECSKKPGSLGVEVIVYPKPEKGESTAFFGCRLTDEPDFYKYGSRVTGVTHWMPLPPAPTPACAERSGDLE